MRIGRSTIGVVVLGLFVTVVAAIVWRPMTVAAAAAETEYQVAEYIIHDRGAIANAMDQLGGGSVAQEREKMRTELNAAARGGWRVKGYSIHTFDNGTEHYFVLEHLR